MIIVTGANGFIGSAMIWQLNSRGVANIIAVDTVHPSERPEPLAKKELSKFLRKNEIWSFLESAEARASVTGIIHMGACSSTTELDVAFLTENNFEYTRKLWDWCAKNEKTFLYASSGAVYGDGSQGFDDATASRIFKPLNPYGESKAKFDRYVEDLVTAGAKTPPHWYGLRFFNVYGPNEYLKGDMASVVFKAYNQIRDSGRLKLFRSHRPDFRDGEQLRDFVYVKDIIRWMDEILIRANGRMQLPAVANGIYNMGYGKARTWIDLASATFNAINCPRQIDFIDIPIDMQPRYQYFTEAKMSRLFAQGLTRPEWPIEKGVSDYIAHHLLKLEKGLDPWL